MSDRPVFVSYEYDDAQFNVFAEDDSTPAGAWPAYLIALLTDWLTYRQRPLRPRRLLQGDLVLEEHHHGVISHVSDFSVVVRYGSRNDAFEVEYPRSQFENGAELNRGDEIEAVIGLLRADRPSVPLDRLYTEDQLKALDADWQQQKGVVGDLKL